MKNPYAVLLGSIRTAKKAAASRTNGKKGGYWQQKRNRTKLPQGLNRLYERHIDVGSLINEPPCMGEFDEKGDMKAWG